MSRPISEAESVEPIMVASSRGRVLPAGSRMVQFLIERFCYTDGSDVKTRTAAAKLLPLVVWVDLAKVALIGPDEDCGAKRYVIPFEEAKGHRSKVGKTSDRDYSVCEHMGSLIE